jgi:uncharacterized Fe-S cluster-containing radical SAM superfamily enzyme
MTSRCNAKTLPETRGPNFVLPAPVVAALCRVRDIEHGTKQWDHWCLYLDSHEGPQKLPAAMERIAKLTDDEERLPRIQDLLAEIQDQLQQHTYQSIVLAGEGEPTLRLADLIELVDQLKKKENMPPIRLTTNGLVQYDSSVPEKLKAAGISKLSVALMTHSPEQYETLMTPFMDNAHEHVCQFIRQALQAGLEVETTAVDYGSIVDKEATEGLSRDVLQVPSPVRWRPYFE